MLKKNETEYFTKVMLLKQALIVRMSNFGLN